MSEARHDSQPPAQGGNETGNGGSVQVIPTSGGVAAGTTGLPQEQQAALLRRHGGATTDGQTVVIINPPPPAKPRWRRTKRLLGNTALMFGLPLAGALIMIALGDSSIMAANDLIASRIVVRDTSRNRASSASAGSGDSSLNTPSQMESRI